MQKGSIIVDGNEAAARVAYALSEVIGIYPITPASPMGEAADQWSAEGRSNLWGSVPVIAELQSEGGAAGALHGSLQAGALTTTFTASQGLLLMLPNLFKIAGELSPTVFHIAARSIACQALSIFCDHSDVMACRGAGWGMLFSNSVQEVMDMAAIAHASTLESRLPFLHIFDGFRVSHEIQKIQSLSDEDLHALIEADWIRAHRSRALNPENPVIRGTAQNPDAFFQARESVNPYYLAAPELVQGRMDLLGARTGRNYRLFDYYGAEDAERVIVVMGSGAETVETTAEHLCGKGEKVGVLKVRLFRPFSIAHCLEALPASAREIAVLDRTKEPGSIGEPLYQDIVSALAEGDHPARVSGGRYGLSSKEFTPAMVHSIYEELGENCPRRHFTVGIHDDVTQMSLSWDETRRLPSDGETHAVFWGLGSDGTVGANKNTIKIIGNATKLNVQGYFVYDSKKAGARTISHLRFGSNPIRRPYLVQQADFIGVHQIQFMKKYECLSAARDGATVLINSTVAPENLWDTLPAEVRKIIRERNLQLHVIDAYSMARELHLGMRINTVMQTAFFILTNVLDRDKAIEAIRESIRQTYGKRGQAVVQRNLLAVDQTADRLHQVSIPDDVSADRDASPFPAAVSAAAPAFVRDVTGPLLAGTGDSLPVSAFPPDGTWPTGTTKWEKRGIAYEIPKWESDLCIQCGKCVLVCPHSVIRGNVSPEETYHDAPGGFEHVSAKWRDRPDQRFTLQVAPDDCTGCRLCVEVCPAVDKSQVKRKAINMVPREDVLNKQRRDWDFFLSLPQATPLDLTRATVKDIQLLPPLFEFSGACAGCGETPYLKLLSQLYGDHILIANATGCSSIYGGNLPTTPWTTNSCGQGPAWSNSLFEDNAEFGLGMRIAWDARERITRQLIGELTGEKEAALAKEILSANQNSAAEIESQRERVAALQELLKEQDTEIARDLKGLCDSLIRKDVWIVGGDGWAYDIGYGGLDHVLASGANVNILVLDTEVYSNTGGQSSKATPLGAVAKFAAGGKSTPKKDLGLHAMTYGNVYVAQIAMGASDRQTVTAFTEAVDYQGPSLIIAYSQCIAHGIDMSHGMNQQKLAERCGHWLLYRYNPARRKEGLNALHIDSRPPSIPLSEYFDSEGRYRILRQTDPEAAARLYEEARIYQEDHLKFYRKLALRDEPIE